MKPVNDPLTITIYLLVIFYIAYVLPILDDALLDQLRNVVVLGVLAVLILYISFENQLLGIVLTMAFVLTLRRLHTKMDVKDTPPPELNVPDGKGLVGNHSLDTVSDEELYVKKRDPMGQNDKNDYKLKEAPEKPQITTVKQQQSAQGMNNDLPGFDVEPLFASVL